MNNRPRHERTRHLSPRFSNLDPDHRPHGPGAILRWALIDRLTNRRTIRPPGPPAPRVEPDRALIRGRSDIPWLMWIGHSSFLGHLAGKRFLIDPVFSNHAGWLYRRHLPPAMTAADLPDIDVIMVTHNHYDHLDSATIRKLPEEIPVVTPRGLGRWMNRRGRRHVIELDWWESAEVNGLALTLVPARHWSRRGVFDTNRSLWGGFVIEGPGRALYHAGDTAWFDGFAEIGRRFPGIDVAMLPIGGYDPPWFMEAHHLNPEQAGSAFVTLGAQCLVPMHWGTFQLTDEPLCEPLDRIREWWLSMNPDGGLEILDVGSTLRLDSNGD